MAFNYSGDPSTSKLDAVRFLIGDTDASYPLTQDAEIGYLISEAGGDVKIAAANAARTIAMNLGRAGDVTVGPVSMSGKEAKSAFLSLADRLTNEARQGDGTLGVPFVGGVSLSEMARVADDSDRPASRFTREGKSYPGRREDRYDYF